MAVVPSRLETALGKVKDGIVADNAGWVVDRFPVDVEPELLADPSRWPAGTSVYGQLVDGDGEEDGGTSRARNLWEREQTAEAVLKLWLYERTLASLSTSWHAMRRKALNSVEKVARDNPFTAGRWTVDWTGWRRLQTSADGAIYAGVAVALKFRFYE